VLTVVLPCAVCRVVSATSRKARILGVVYNASNNELVRTNTLVKNAIIQVDATPFRQWYEQHYGQTIGKKAKAVAGAEVKEEEKKSKAHIKKAATRVKDHTLDAALKDQFMSGRLYASISSRPGQSGRCDGYILEDKELEFYLRKLTKKK
jgi:small subunit ribosomal protein S8e